MAATFSVFFIICFVVPFCISSPSPRLDRSSIIGIFRSKREVCTDGTYEVQGRTCCLCSAGQRVETECTSTPDDGKCTVCEVGTYNSEPSSQSKCQPCTSCEQSNANLEEEEACTTARNTKCRCKKGFFCSSNECTICQPCTTCDIDGIKEECTPTHDTVCNDAAESTDGIGAGGRCSLCLCVPGQDTEPKCECAIAGIVLVVVLVVGAIIAAGYVIKNKRETDPKRRGKNLEGQDIPLLADIGPHLPDIANELGWKDMKNIAIRMGVANGIIESCEMDNKDSAEERTLQLLMRWVEREGKEAPEKLIRTLEKMDKRGKAEKIIDILAKDNSASSKNSASNI